MHDDAVDVRGAGVHDPAAALAHDLVGEVPEGVGHAVDVDPALLQGLAGVPALDQADLLAVALEQVGDPAQQRRPLGHGGTGPLPVPPAKAALAAATAASASSAPPSATTWSVVASAGSRTSRVAPAAAARHSPAT